MEAPLEFSARIFASLAHPLRLHCIVLLAHHNALCVCDIAQQLGVSQPTISRHLATLRRAGLVSDQRQGTRVIYRLRADLPEWAQGVVGALGRRVPRSRNNERPPQWGATDRPSSALDQDA